MSKTIKFMISTVLIFFAFTIISEFYVAYLCGFETRYTYVTFYKQHDTNKEQMMTDLLDAAEEHNVSLFIVDRQNESAIKQRVDIYAMQQGRELLAKNHVREGDYNSLFWGKLGIRIKDFSDIEDITIFSDYKVIGNNSDIVKFKQELVDKYAGAFPREGYSEFRSELSVVLVWCVIFAFFLLLTLYETSLKKKEMVIRLVSGQSLERFVLKNIMADSVLYTVVFGIQALLMCVFSYGEYCMDRSILSFVIFLMFNGLIFCRLLFINYKKDVASKSSLRSVLKISYVYKMCSMALVVFLIAENAAVIHKGLDYYRQNDFFQKYKDYSYISLIPGDSENYEETQRHIVSVTDEFLRGYFENGTALTLYDIGYEAGNDNYVWANGGALEYLEERISELSAIKFDQKVYVIQPADYKKSGNEKESAESFVSAYTTYECDSDDCVLLTYQEDAQIVTLHRGDRMEGAIMKNPVIIFDNTQTIIPEREHWYYAFVQLSELEWQTFLSGSDFQEGKASAYLTNAYENYYDQWLLIKKGMLISIILFIFLLLLEVIIMNQLLSYEYKVNAVRLAVKKVMGGSFLSRYGRLFKNTILTSIISLAVALSVCYWIDVSLCKYIVAGVMLVLLIELTISFLCIRRLERLNVIKILKGGVL